jgi:hypothetical protein
VRPAAKAAALSLAILMFALTLEGGKGRAETPSYPFTVRPISKPVEMSYRPVKRSPFTSGTVAVERVGVDIARPLSRMSGSIRIDPAGEDLALTYEVKSVQPKAAGDEFGGLTLRLLLSPKGEVLDAVAASGSGHSGFQDNRPLLAEFAQSLYLEIPRFPAHPVASADRLYDYEWDLGRKLGAGVGRLLVRVTGTVRGTTTYNGREMLVVDYRCAGHAGNMRFSEQGYQLIDLATGLVGAAVGQQRLEDDQGHATWTSGYEVTFK